jgi:hypothetical protein
MIQEPEKPDGTKTKTRSDDGALKSLTQGSTEHPKVFLSYAWSDPEHKERVRLFANRLISKGVEVILDVYDNKPGHELNSFMEQAVTDKTVTHVLVITDKIYADKADARTGGVGTETQLISSEVYKKIDQTKVVPLVFERTGERKPCLPAYMQSRHYIDFTDESQFESNFDELIRHIYNQPKHVKPLLGPVPNFTAPTKHAAEKIPLPTKPATSLNHSQSGFDNASTELTGILKKLREIGDQEKPIDEKVLDGIKAAEPYVNTVLNELNVLLSESDIDDKRLTEKIDRLLSSAKAHQGPLAGVNSWRDIDYEQIGFVVQELAMSVIALLLKYRRYSAINSLINRTYFYRTHTGEQHAVAFNDFYQYMQTLDEHRNHRMNLNRVSIAADIHKENASKFDVIDFDDLKNADSLLYLLTRFNFPDNRYAWWFPKLSVYSHRFDGQVEPLGELISKARANEIVKMFGLETVGKLLEAHKAALEATSKISYNAGFNFNIPSLENMFPEKIAELP